MKNAQYDVNFIDLGIIDYESAYKIQSSLIKKRVGGAITDTVLLLEHKPVITIGRSGKFGNIVNLKKIKEMNIEIKYADRGGDVTYHGPGQLVIYPIINLNNLKKDIRRYIDTLEFLLYKIFNKFGLKIMLIPGRRGAWIENRKIASIGIAIKKWVAYHGLSINVNMDLSPFNFIKPCGYTDIRITSILNEIKRFVTVDNIKDIVKNEFTSVIGGAYGRNKISGLAYKTV